MATKKTAGKDKKNAPEKTAAKGAKKKAAKKPARKVMKGNKYACGVCGLVVSVNEVCGCVDECDIICCGKRMEPGK